MTDRGQHDRLPAEVEARAAALARCVRRHQLLRHEFELSRRHQRR